MSAVPNASSSSTPSTQSASKTNKYGTGIDYAALIDAKVQSRLAPATKLDTKVKKNETKVKAYGDLQARLKDMDAAITGLRNRTTSTGSTKNLYDEREVYLSGGGATGAKNILSADASDKAPMGTYSVVVKQIATKNKIGGSPASGKDTALGAAGSMTIGLAGGKTATINVGSGDSLTDVAAAINKETSATGIVASVLKVSDTSYELVLTANDTGKAITVSDGTGGVAKALGLIDSSGAIANELVQAKPAILSVDGVEITRLSNTISDAIDGVSIDLYTAAPGDAITLEVSHDLTDIKSAITKFVEAYNALRDLTDTLTATNSDGTAAESATLFSDTQLRAITAGVSGIAVSSVTNAGGEVLSLADLGIKLNKSNKLETDETKLNDTLLKRIDDVQKLLGLDYSSSDEGMRLLRYDMVQPRLDLDLDIQMNSDGTIASVKVGGDDSSFTVSGNRIVGKAGTPYDGLVLVYVGAGGHVSVKASQGLFDQLSSFDKIYNDPLGGSLQKTIEELQKDNDKMTAQADTIRDRAESYRSNLSMYYARLEAAAEAANIKLKQLKASVGLKDSDD